MKNTCAPVCRHRLGEKGNDETGNSLRFHEHQRVAEINAFFFPAPDAIALEGGLFSVEWDSEVATGSQPRPRNLLNGYPCVVLVLHESLQVRGFVLQETIHVIAAHRAELPPAASRRGRRCEHLGDDRICPLVCGRCTACRRQWKGLPWWRSYLEVGWHLEQPPARAFDANDALILEPPQFLKNLKLLDLCPAASHRVAQLGGRLRAGSEGKSV